MTWRQYVRAVAADARRRQKVAVRAERDAMARQRQLARQEREWEKASDAARAETEVAQFDTYLDVLVSVHKECGPPWDWRELANEGPPVAPVREDRHAAPARAALESYRPGFFARLFGGAKKQTAALQAATQGARAADDQEHADAVRSYQEAHASWSTSRALAARMIQMDVAAYADALMFAGAFDELSAFQTRVDVADAQPEAVAFTCTLTDDEIVPREELKLTAGRKITTKPMAGSRYWTLYQDHVCSAALRVAAEAFAVLPISRAVVNIGPVRVNTQTGHREPATYLAVHVVRDSLRQLNLVQIDPSDSMKNFPHRMKFKKSSGFESVEPMTLDEHWVTT